MSYPSISSYITIIRKFKIAHRSVILSYDTSTNTKKCIHPLGWQKTKFQDSIYEPTKNAIIQNTGPNSNIIVIDVDGTEHPTNKIIIELCKKYCKFYNKTKKGYHFFFLFNDSFPKSQSIKYNNDPTNSGSQSAPGLASAPGIDIKSTGGCVYYGSYYIGKTLVQYENVIAEDIIHMPLPLIKELDTIFTKSIKPNQRVTTRYPNTIKNTSSEFPKTILIDIDTLNKLLKCFPNKCFESYIEWFTMCFLIKQSNHTEAAFQLFYKYSKAISKYSNVTEQECRNKWNSITYEPNFVFQEMIFIARKHNYKLFKNIQLPWFRTQETLFKPIQFNSQYLNYEYLIPYYQNNKYLAIKSPYGTGKTQFLATLFQNIDPNTSILFITPRVSLSYTLLNSFPQFTHYQNREIHDLSYTNKLIIQLDSIHKLNNYAPKYDPLEHNRQFINSYIEHLENIQNITQQTKFDIIALDEIESLLYHLSFDKIKTNHIFNILTQICIQSQKVIALDGDFSNRSYHFLNTIENTHKPVILQNIYQPEPNHFMFTNDYAKFNTDLDNNLTTNKNIVIICLTLSASEFYYSKYRSTYNTKIHNSIQNDRSQLTNVNNHWQCKLLIYTSTIESGCDFNITWFDKCYIILSNKGTSPRGLMQMFKRVRTFSDKNIMVYNNGVPFYEYQIPYQFDDVKYTQFSSLLNTDKQLNPLNTILCHNETERLNKQYYITILTQLLVEKGHTYEYLRTPNTTPSKITSDIYKDITDADNILDEVQYDELVRIVKLPETQPTIARKYYFMIKKYIMAKLWNLDINTIILADVKTYYPKINKLLNYKLFNKYTTPNNNLEYPNIKIDRKIRYVLQILRQFNITHPEQFDYSIDAGPSHEARKHNKKTNPNIITQQAYQTIQTTLTPLIKERDFRMTFDLEKLKGELSDRMFLETIKKVIDEFGFTVVLNQTTVKSENRKLVQINSYFVDLDISIIELLNFSTRDYIDDIIDEDIIMDREGDIDDDNEDLAFINPNQNNQPNNQPNNESNTDTDTDTSEPDYSDNDSIPDDVNVDLDF